MPTVVGITGYKRSGKGTVAQLLSENYTGVVYDIGFADKVKIAGAKALGFSRPPRELIALMDEFKIDGHISATYREPGATASNLHDLTGREYLQWIGTEVGRDLFGTDFWIDQVLPRPVLLDEVPSDLRPRAEQLGNAHNLEARYPDIDVVAITDLRFSNEADRIKALGGVIWRVNRPGTETGDGHASEQPLPDTLIDVEIDNSGDFDDLSDEVYRAMEESGV